MNTHHLERLKMFPSCRLVAGASHSAIYDLERRKLFRFPNAWLPLVETVAELEGLVLQDLQRLDPHIRAKCQAALDFLLSNELSYRADRLAAGALADLPMDWHAPHDILDAVVDVDQIDHDWPLLLDRLQAMGCRTLQVRSFSERFDVAHALAMLEALETSPLSHVHLLLKWHADWEAVPWRDWFDRFGNLVAVRIHAAPEARVISGAALSPLPVRTLAFETRLLAGPDGCGRIDDESAINLPGAALFSELQSFNGCLHRKVAVRSDGEICNCPSLKTTYGKDLSTLPQIVSTPAFRKTWYLKKDLIDDCSVCEYRYACTDCRAHLGSDTSTARPARCAYDPHRGVWARLDREEIASCA